MRRWGRQPGGGPCSGCALGASRGAFTLVEVLVVTVIITLLLGIMLPNVRRVMRQARTTVCKANLQDLNRSLQIYRMENDGWLPLADDPAQRALGSWAIKLFERNPAGRPTLICPSDPLAPLLRNNVAAGVTSATLNSSYGMNDFMLSSPNAFLANVERFQPSRPGDTILLADMGPDMVVSSSSGAGAPSRNFGRLAVDDNYQPAAPPDDQGDPWLTARHVETINVLTLQGNVRPVLVQPVLLRPVEPYYFDCARQGCTLCLSLDMAHYSFQESATFWWTGRVPAH